MSQGGEVPWWSQLQGKSVVKFWLHPHPQDSLHQGILMQHGKKDKFLELAVETVPQQEGRGGKRPFHLQSPTRDLVTYLCTKKPRILSATSCSFNSSDKLLSEIISGRFKNNSVMSWASFVCSSDPGAVAEASPNLQKECDVQELFSTQGNITCYYLYSFISSRGLGNSGCFLFHKIKF